MKWRVLVDNRTNDGTLQTEHGLAILLETEKHRVLLDTGASDMLIGNAECLGLDLGTVDYVFVSHGHSDHAGGLRYFMEMNQTAKVIVSPDAISGKFYSKRRCLHSITTEWPEIPAERLLTIEHSGWVADDLYVIARIPQVHPIPKGNQYLFVQDVDGEYIQDDFRHELALYTDGLVGGFHLLDGHETEEELLALAQRLSSHYPNTQFYTSHCTGDAAFDILRSEMGGKMNGFWGGIRNYAL